MCWVGLLGFFVFHFAIYSFVSLIGNKHDDGTQSDSENAGAHRHYSKRAALEEHLRHHHTELKKSHQKVHSTDKQEEQAGLSQTAFMIEFFDEDHPRKRRSYSFSQNVGALCPESPSPTPHARAERVKPTSGEKAVPSSVQASSSHQRAVHGVHAKLLKQKSEEPSAALPVLQAALLRSSGSLGHRPGPNQEMDKKLKSQHFSAATEKDNEDDQSDKGTYTIELENPNSEEMEARKMIDKVRKRILMLKWYVVSEQQSTTSILLIKTAAIIEVLKPLCNDEI